MYSITTVIEPAETAALTTLERVKLELGIDNTDGDEILIVKIAEASSDIAVRCAPTLRRETVTQTFYPDRWSECVSALRLRNYPVAAIIDRTVEEIIEMVPTDVLIPGVIVDGVGLDAAEYRFVPENGLLYRANFPWAFCQSVAVTYRGGYLLPGQANRNLPASIEAACVELVSGYWHSRGRDPLVKSETNFGVAEFQYWVGAVGEAGDLPPGVMQKISPYLIKGAFA
jgi:hypothetical protein